MKENHALNHLADVFEDAPREHNLSDFDKLEAVALLLQFVVGRGGLLMDERKLGVLRALEEVKVADVVLRIVNRS